MNKKVCYTCITGGYDNVPVHKFVNPEWEYVLFTDNAGLIERGYFEHWKVRPLAYNKSTNVKNARWHKINAHILFPEYDISLWLDGNISVNNANIFNKANALIADNVLISIPLHPQRNCIYDEAQAVKKHKIDTDNVVDKQMRVLHDDGYPENNGLVETNVMFRQHNKIKPLLEMWWYFVLKHSKRDQLSYNYCAWKNGIKTEPMYEKPGEHRENGDFDFIYAETHNQDKITAGNGLPYWLGWVISHFIPARKNRNRFMRKHVKSRKKK